MQKALKIPTRVLKQNVIMPMIGFGGYSVPNNQNGKSIIKSAIDLGYRHFDTGQYFKTHQIVGEAIRESGIPRKDFFVTSKVWYTHQQYDKAKQAIDDSLSQLNIEYIDLMLINWPGNNVYSYSDPRNAELRKGTWKALEEGCMEGRLKSIGVSNFKVRHLKELLDYAKIAPSCNQFQLHPLYQQQDTINLCENNNIAIVAYCSLMRMNKKLINNQTIVKIAENYGRGATEILLRWALAHNYAVIPKSANVERQESNLRVMDFDLEVQQINEIDSLNQMKKLCWNSQKIA